MRVKAAMWLTRGRLVASDRVRYGVAGRVATAGAMGIEMLRTGLAANRARIR
jgi:hypothetical protein